MPYRGGFHLSTFSDRASALHAVLRVFTPIVGEPCLALGGYVIGEDKV